MRIAVAGFQHETNSFAPSYADLAAFEMADSWPGLLCGEEVLEGTRGMNLPMAGFIEAASRDRGTNLFPLLWCAAEPSGPVTDNTFDEISNRILEGLVKAGPLDGIYLDLHGAMITESLLDGEGELLSRVRHRVGNHIFIAISLDLHANVSPTMVHLADAICVFRSYPHLDMAKTGARAYAALKSIIDAGAPPARAFRQAPFLIPLHAQHTGSNPAASLYAGLADFDRAPDSFVEIAMGFTAGDTPDTGISIVAHAATSGVADQIADEVLSRVLAAEDRFDTELLSAETAVATAISMAGERPVIIADVQDNPGAGATSDTTGILKALVRAGASGAIVGLLQDPEAAKAAHVAGIGGMIEIALGGKSGLPGQEPFYSRFLVEKLGDGHCVYSGEMYGGGTAMLGPTAVLRVQEKDVGVQVVVTSIRNQCLDLAHFTHIGLAPKQAKIIVVKSTAHFRADFEPIARSVLLTASPGAFPCCLNDIPFARLRTGVRI